MPCTAPGITVWVASAPAARSRATPARECSGWTPTTPRRVPSRLPWITRILAPASGDRSSCSGIHGARAMISRMPSLPAQARLAAPPAEKPNSARRPRTARTHHRHRRGRIGDERFECPPRLDPVAHLREPQPGAAWRQLPDQPLDARAPVAGHGPRDAAVHADHDRSVRRADEAQCTSRGKRYGVHSAMGRRGIGRS